MKAFRVLLLVMAFILLLTSAAQCSSFIVDEEEQPATLQEQARFIMRNMTLEEKIYQLFFVTPEALTGEKKTNTIDDLQLLSRYPVGGIIHFAGNITSPAQISAFNESLQEASFLPLFLCADEEGGTVARLANHPAFDLPKFKNAASVGASENPEDARKMGMTIGAYLSEHGFNVDFAPVADVNTNPDNPVIGKRAFSSSAEVVTEMAAAMAEGLNSQGIAAAFKHFPGHGDTDQDSHSGLAVTYRTGRQLANCEILPFLRADNNDFIMVGHIAVPEETGNLTPASLSPYMVSTILKGNLAFEGLVITDSLSMEAITGSYSSGEAALAALTAGCDLLLMPENLPEAFEAVMAALEDGTLTQEWLDETVYRILRFKQMHGIWVP